MCFHKYTHSFIQYTFECSNKEKTVSDPKATNNFM